jgi:hypothetical protein
MNIPPPVDGRDPPSERSEDAAESREVGREKWRRYSYGVPYVPISLYGSYERDVDRAHRVYTVIRNTVYIAPGALDRE